VIQRRGRVETDYKNRQKVCFSKISQISTQNYGSGHFDPFKIARKIRPIGGRLRNHSDQSEDALRILKLNFCLLDKN